MKLQTFIQKKKRINLWPKKLYLGFWSGKLKSNCHICNQRPPICLMTKFRVKIIIPKFGHKNILFRYFGQQFWKNIVIFAISAFESALMESLVQKIKILKFVTKIAWLGYFGAGIWKQYCHIWNQHPKICVTGKFREKTKLPKFRTKCLIWVFLTKTTSCGYFWARIKNNYCEIWNHHP